MIYVEAFVTPVPTAARDAYVAHARAAQAMLVPHGIARMAEYWGDDVPDGRVTDFPRAVRRTGEETVVFSWFEYPDRAARDAANAAIMADPRMADMASTMPFDGRRMIYGGFAGLIDEGAGVGGYVDGFLAAVPDAKRDAYIDHARHFAALFREFGALRVVETWADDVGDGDVTDFRRAVQAEAGESVVFAWIEWPDRATRMAGWAALEQDPRMTPPGELPFDGQRMVYGGFERLDLGEGEAA